MKSLEPDFNVLFSLQKDQAIVRNQFAIWMRESDKDQQDGELTIGGFNQKRLASNVVWMPISGDSWSVPLEGIASDGALQQFELLEKPYWAQLDSGTAMLAGEPGLVTKLLQLLEVAEDCSNMATRPKLGFKLHGHLFQLRPSDYVRRTNGGCFPLFSSVALPRPTLLLGYPFLRRYYSIYDAQSLQLGLAVAMHATGANDPPMQEQAKDFILKV